MLRFINTLIEMELVVPFRYKGGGVNIGLFGLFRIIRVVLLKRTKMTKRAKVTNITNKTIFTGGGKKTTYTSSLAISELIVSSIGLDRRV